MTPRDLGRRVAAVAAIAFALATLLAFLPHSNSWWGADALRFYPLPFQLAWCAAGLALLGLGAAWAARGETRAPEPAAAPARRTPLAWVAALGAALAGGLVFHLLRARQLLAGDGYTTLDRLARHEPLATRSPVFDLLEPATLKLVQALRGPGVTLTRGGVLNSLLGALLVGVVTLVAVRLARRGRGLTGAALAALVLTQPALQLFCGYPGPQGLLAAALAVLCLAGLEAGPGQRLLGRGWEAAALLLVLVEMIGLALRPAGATFRAPLAPAAWLNALNQMWLVGAPALVLLVALATLPRGREALRARAAWLPLGVAGLALALRVVLITPLGALREWELFAVLGVALTGAAAAALVALRLDDAPAPDAPRASGAPLVALLALVGLFFTGPWVGLQADAARGVDRHLSVAEGKPPLPPGVLVRYHQAMGQRFAWLGQTYLAAQAYRRAYGVAPSFEDAWRSGLYYMACGRVEDAGGAFTECLRRRPGDWQVMTELGNALTGLNQYARADSVLERAIAANPAAAAPRIHLARSLAMEGRGPEARAMLESARGRLEPKSPLQADFRKLDENLPK